MAHEPTLEEQIEEVERELAIRERVYPRWINASKPKISPAVADKQMKRMRAVRDSLIRLRDLRNGSTP